MSKKLLFPMIDIGISQGSYGDYSHSDKYALDIAGKDSSASIIYTSEKCKVKTVGDKYIYLSYDGDYEKTGGGVIVNPTIMYYHQTNKDLVKGQPLDKWEPFLIEGKLGNATGNHIHVEAWPGSTRYGYEVAPESIFWCKRGLHNFVYNKSKYLSYWIADERNENIDQLKIDILSYRIRKSPGGEILGYAEKGYWNILEVKTVDGMQWVKVYEDMWIGVTDSVKIVKAIPQTKQYLVHEVTQDEIIEEDGKSVVRFKAIGAKTGDRILLER